MKKSCGIYEIKNDKGRVSYKIFAGSEELEVYLKKNKDKLCEKMTTVFYVNEYREYPNIEVRKLSFNEIARYMSER